MKIFPLSSRIEDGKRKNSHPKPAQSDFTSSDKETDKSTISKTLIEVNLQYCETKKGQEEKKTLLVMTGEITILYGSETGNAEEYAKYLKQRLDLTI